MLKLKVFEGEGHTLKIGCVEYTSRPPGPKRKYYEILRKEIIKQFKAELFKNKQPWDRHYTGGKTGRHSLVFSKYAPQIIREHSLVFSKYAPQIIREFKEKYKNEYNNGFNAYVNSNQAQLTGVLNFLKGKLSIDYTGVPKVHFDFKLN